MSFLLKTIITIAIIGPGSRTLGQRTITFPIFQPDEAISYAKAREILNYMKLKVDPCDDFYEYACGNWNKYHTLTKQENETPLTLLNSKINKDLHKLLDENVTIDDTSTSKKVKTFYKSCLETKRNEQHHQDFLNEFIKSNGGFPAIPGSNWLIHHHNYDWQQIVAQLRYKYGMNILVGMEIDINYQSMHENSIYLGEPETIIPKHLCSYMGTRKVDITDQEYVAIEKEVADNLSLWLSLNKEEAWKLAADILTFEHDLCSAMYINEEEEQDFIGSSKPEVMHRKYARKTLIEFTHQLQNKINLNIIVAGSFGIPFYKPVFMKSPQYFEQLLKVMDMNNSTTVANYIMYRAISHINLPRNDTLLTRPSYCLQVVKKYFPKILGDMYHRKFADLVAQEQVQTIFEKLKDIFADSFQQDWIESSTGRLGKNKLMELNLYFPTDDKTVLNLQFNRSEYWSNLRDIMGKVREWELSRVFATGLPKPKDEVQAYESRLVFRPYHKRIDMGWGLFQPPFYQPQLTNSMRFAIIGQKLAEAMAYAFDDYGWSSDISGHNNWDPSTAVEFYKRANCLRQQVGNYLKNDPESFRNASKTRDLIAKTVAVKIAFNAYLNWLMYQNPNNDHGVLSKETLYGLNFTNTQLFFIAFAQMQCEEKKKEKVDRRPSFVLSPLERHSISRYEVNGPLANFEEFGREFGCTMGSDMNLADKCIIY